MVSGALVHTMYVASGALPHTMCVVSGALVHTMYVASGAVGDGLGGPIHWRTRQDS